MFRIKELFSNTVMQRVFKSTCIYAGGDLLNKAIPFLLIPILTRYLSTTDYGVLATFMAISGIIHIIISMGTIPAIMRGYFDRGKNNFSFPEFVFNGLLINFIAFSVIFLLWIILQNYLKKWIPIPFGFQLLIPISGFFAVVTMVPSQLWVYMKKPLNYTIFNTTSTFLEVVCSIWLVVFLSFGWDGRILGIFVGKGVFFIIAIYVLIRSRLVSAHINVEYLKSMLKFGGPVILHSLGYVVVAAIDRFFLNAFIDLSTTGVYSVSYSICTIILFITGALHLTLSPLIYEKLDNATEALKRKLVKYTYCYFLLISVGVVIFISFAPSFLDIYLGKEFLGAKQFIFWLALGFGFNSFYIMIVTYIWYSKKTIMLSKIAIGMILLSFLFNYIFIKWNGAVGVAQATCLVFFSQFVMAWYASNKVYPMPWLTFYRTKPV